MRNLPIRTHPASWALWFASAMVVVLMTSNPLYHTTIALCAVIVYVSVRPPRSDALDALLIIGWLFALLSMPLNLVTGSTGATELFSLPTLELPGWLGSVMLGGPVTAESLVYAVDQALAVAAIISVVCAFNAGVDHVQLLRLTPPGFAQLGIVVSVGLLLIPETLARATSLREARLTRGRPSGWTATLVLLIPLLGDALERAVQRAESLDARGFGVLAVPSRRSETALSVSGLLLAAIGAFSWYYAPDQRFASGAILLLGAALVVATVWRQASRGTGRRMFIARMRQADWLIAASAAASVAIFVSLRLAGIGDVTYLPFPELHAPSYHLAAAAACLLLLAPIGAGGRR